MYNFEKTTHKTQFSMILVPSECCRRKLSFQRREKENRLAETPKYRHTCKRNGDDNAKLNAFILHAHGSVFDGVNSANSIRWMVLVANT